MAVKIPVTQALSSATFKAPLSLLEGQNTSIPQLYEWNAENNPQHPLFRYYDGSEIKDIMWPEAVQAIRRVAHSITHLVRNDPKDVKKPPVIAVVANTDTITYWTFIVGVLRAGCAVFPISTRNSAAAITSLLCRTKALHLFCSSETSIHGLAQTAVDGAKTSEEGALDIELHHMPVFEDLFTAPSQEYSRTGSLPEQFDPEGPALILHSSGSTAFPKPVTWSHRSFMNWGLTPWFGEVDLANVVVAAHSTPMFHAIGVIQLCFAPSCGMIVATFKPSSPPTFPTAESVFEGVVVSKSQLICCVPSFIEQWSRDPEKVVYMQSMKGIMFGGAPLTKEVGDMLISKGVKIFVLYGSTETCVVNMYLPAQSGPDWDYIEFSKQCRTKLVSHGDGTYELIMISHAIHEPRFTNTKVDGQDAYATSDLFIPHPTKPNLWKVWGRTDDQIVLSNGEKVNPGPLESILCQDPRVLSAVIFGRGRFQIGVVIDPAPGVSVDVNDATSLAAFRNSIWRTVERANNLAPQHGRLFKEMILVASPSKPFAYTAKSTPRRHVIIKLYDQEIENLYDAVEQTTQKDLDAPHTWGYGETLAFIRKAVRTVLSEEIADDANLFEQGCDSLQATWIRNTLLRALRASAPHAAQKLPVNVVFQAPSVVALAEAVTAALDLTMKPLSGAETVSKAEELARMIQAYSSDFPARPKSLKQGPSRDVVLISGTTSGFGCDILSHLLHDDSVEKVYAFNRRGPNVSERQRASFRERGLDEAELLSPKFYPVEGDLSAVGFGIDAEVFSEIRDSVTHIIHNAWRVDFNLTVASFESNIKATRNLVDMSLVSPHVNAPRLVFIGSIGVIRNPTAPGLAPEAHVEDPSIPIGSGYSESKWVTERILAAAAERTELRPVIVRLGQVCGNRVGYWNEREWFPSLVKSAVHQKCLPDLSGDVSWIPSYEAAKAVTEMRKSPHPVLHLIHPKPVSWNSLLRTIAAELQVPLVPYKQWLDALQSDVQENSLEVEQLRHNPALRLLEFYKNAPVNEDREPLGIARLSFEKALEVSPALNLPRLEAEHVKKWVAAWRASGFLPAA